MTFNKTITNYKNKHTHASFIHSYAHAHTLHIKKSSLAVSSNKKRHGCFVTPSQTFSSSASDQRAPVSFICEFEEEEKNS